MSNTAETPDLPPPAARNPRSRALVITAVVLVAAFLGLTTFSGFYTDRLWYVSGGYAGVFTTLIWTRIGLFVVTGLLMALVVCLNVVLAYRLRPIFVGMGDPNGMGRYREAVTPIRRLVVLGIGLVLLVGVMAKNGILIVEFANQLRDEGMEFLDAIKEASLTRLRPIVMTSLTTAAVHAQPSAGGERSRSKGSGFLAIVKIRRRRKT